MGGKTEIVKGRIKEAAGALTGNDELRDQGKTDQIAGNAKQAVQATVEEAKKAARNVADTLRNQFLSFRRTLADWRYATGIGRKAITIRSASFERELNADVLPRAYRNLPFEVSLMKRFIILCMILTPAAVVTIGCEQKSTMERKETVTTAEGSTTTTDTHKVESSGANPPSNARGEKAN